MDSLNLNQTTTKKAMQFAIAPKKKEKMKGRNKNLHINLTK